MDRKEEDLGAQIIRLAGLSSALGDRLSRLTPAYVSGLSESTFSAYARALIKARRKLAARLPGGVIADPGLDILLDLFASAEDHVQVSVSSCCFASGVPPTTALRWISLLERHGMIQRQKDVHDKRRQFLTLSPNARELIISWLDEVSGIPLVR